MAELCLAKTYFDASGQDLSRESFDVLRSIIHNILSGAYEYNKSVSGLDEISFKNSGNPSMQVNILGISIGGDENGKNATLLLDKESIERTVEGREGKIAIVYGLPDAHMSIDLSLVESVALVQSETHSKAMKNLGSDEPESFLSYMARSWQQREIASVP